MKTNEVYALRRSDTKEYYRTPRRPLYCNWKHDDPRLSNWVSELEKAKLYSWRGICALAGSMKHYYTVEVVKVKLQLVEEDVLLSDLNILKPERK